MGSIWREKEVRRLFGAMCTIGLPLTGLCCFFDARAGVAAALMLGSVLVLSFCFNQKRYHQIHRISQQLSEIANGCYHIDIREYAEGELSILSSEILKITSTLSFQADRLQKDKAFLADSLADISHQLKTPLTSISISLELLDSPSLPPAKRQEFLDAIRSSTQRIQWLVTSLLKLSRLDAGTVPFHAAPVSLSAVIDQAAEPLRIPLELKNQTLSVHCPESLIRADAHWLAEAVGNILKNCIEHTPVGGHIQIHGEENSLYTKIEIMDNGPGILPEDLPHIFERFYRGKNLSMDSIGIGLALSKSIVEHMGGTLTASNLPDGGAHFVVTLYPATSM